MRCVYAMALLVLTTTLGCASHPTPKEPAAPVAQLSAPAAALAFDVPAGGLAEYAFSRSERDLTAYVGYDESIITYSYVRTDDRQILFDDFNDFDRRAYTTRVGVSYR